MKLLIIDTETTGKENTVVCELAATLYQVGENERTTGAIASISTLLPVSSNDAESINGICSELTLASLELLGESVMLLKKMAFSSSYAIAFNAEFDAPLVNQLIGEQRWLCAMRDFDWEYPNKNAYGSFRLVDLALWLGIGISTVHRAPDDVRLLVECLNRRKEVLPEMIEKAIATSRSPLIQIKANVSYEDRELAKRAGFGWDGERKIWVKKIRECNFVEFAKSLNFGVDIA